MDKKWKKRVAYAMKAIALFLRTPLINFDVNLPEIVGVISEKLKDDKLSDEDLADILTYIAKQIEKEE